MAALAACSVVAHATTAWGSTTVGQLFDPIDGCAANSIYLQTSVPSGNGYTIPSDGVITKWSYQFDAVAPSGVRLEVGSPGSAGMDTMVAQAMATPETPGAVGSYPAQIPVRAGDIIGIFVASGGNCITGFGTGDIIDFHAGDLSPGASDTFTPVSGNRVPVQATVEPDADHDGYGDETQDQCPTDASTHGPCPPGPQAPRDTRPPVLSVVATTARLSRGRSISFFVRSNEAATGTATGTIALPKTARVVRFKKTRVSLRAHLRSRITLRLARREAAKVRAALRRHRLKAKVIVSVKDAAGNATVKRLVLKLKR